MFIFPMLRADSHGPLLSHYLACICWIPGHLQSWEASAPRAWPAWWGWRARDACARSGWVSPSYTGSDWASYPARSRNPNLSKEQDIYLLGSSPSIFGEKKGDTHGMTWLVILVLLPFCWGCLYCNHSTTMSNIIRNNSTAFCFQEIVS